MKADLWRYCIIYKYGSIYADSDTVSLTNNLDFLVDNTSHLVITSENDVHFCQFVFAAPPNSPVLMEIINLSVNRILHINKIKGEHIIHHLTGPGVFSDGIIKYLIKNKLPLRSGSTNGNYHCLQYNHYSNKALHVLEHNDFHQNKVNHFFS